MAEAAAGARLDAALRAVRGDVSLVADEEGTYSLTLTFNPYRLKKRLSRFIFRAGKIIQSSIWPLTPSIVTGGVALVVLRVVTAPPGSWWRSGWLAEILWEIDNMFPWQKTVPTNLRVAWLSLVAGATGFAGISLTQRSLLRVLLNYQGWMFLSHGQKPGWFIKTWFFMVKAISTAKPSLYNFQGSLPSLPVPPLKQTTTKFLSSVEALLPSEEYKEMQDKVESFLKKEGPKLQFFLWLQSLYKTNWLWDWWEKYVYLRGRAPIMVNSNYYIMDGVFHTPTHMQAARTAGMLMESDKFKHLLDWEEFQPVRLQKTIPWCMKQYERVFDTTRIPGKECDQIKHYDHDPQRYVAVSRKGVWYKLNMLVKGKNGTWRTALPHELEKQLEFIIQDSDANPAPEGENSIAALTGWHRGRWAEARESHFWEGINKSSLQIVEKAFMHIHLDDKIPKDMTEQAKLLLHGDGKSLWFDKSVTFVSFPNGKCGLMAEHSYADALTVAHYWEWITTGERLNGGYYREDGHCKGYDDASFEQVKLTPPQRLFWNIEPELKKTISEAVVANTELCNDLDLCLLWQKDWGKGFMKKVKISPDAFAQLALQLAYKRNAGKRALTYEASVTRLFCMGRTETVRVLSLESAAFVDAMMDEKATAEEKVKKLRQAADKHADTYKACMVGNGIDRHLFGLYVCAVGLGYDCDFLKSALKMPWTLSTSQTPQKQTEGRWNPEGADKHVISPGGGFGPVAEDGYGVSYMFANDDNFFAHISSKKSCAATSSEKFKSDILQAFNDMKKALEDAGAVKPAAKSSQAN